ncbi:MAG TPA: alpha/beta hydrolase [Kofleriaceae bacterium]|nr:alpha/beta hydrolase [Kofleriaceae bacterium]
MRRALALIVLLPALAAAEKPRWEALPMPPPMPKAEASGHVEVGGGARIYYATYGKPAAPPVILLHGGLGNGDHFGYQVPALAEKFRVIAIDSRGQGRSTLAKGKLSYQAMAADVVAVMDALRLPKASIAGWSDGGAIALALGIGFGDRVDKLFVFGTNYDRFGSKSRTTSSATFNAYAAKCRSDFQRIAKSPKAYDAAVAALLPVWRDPTSFTKEQLRSIKAPTLVADGDHDEVIELAQVKEMATLIPNGRLAVLKDTSHFALWQDPAAFNKVLVEFLSSR